MAIDAFGIECASLCSCRAQRNAGAPAQDGKSSLPEELDESTVF